MPNGGPDSVFLRSFRKLILSKVKQGQRFIIVTGGGKTARHYIDAAQNVRKKIEDEDLDWLGIHATRLNGHLMRTIFFEIAHPVVIKNPKTAPSKWKGKILIGAGVKPGQSSDHATCELARRYGITSVINISNVDHVYDADPRKKKNAKPIEEMSWKDYRAMVGDKWSPGLSAPFDPVASKYCDRNNIQVAIVDGADMKNLAKVISGRIYTGTRLH